MSDELRPMSELRERLRAAAAAEGRMSLTRELLLIRIERLARDIAADHGPIEEELFRRVRCDRCGFVFDLLSEGVYPVGWTTSGDFEHGFTDLCRACSG